LRIFAGVLSSAEDFENGDDIWEAVGEILCEVGSDKSDDDIKTICERFYTLLRPENDKINVKHKQLAVPFQFQTTTDDSDIENMKSIWLQQKKDALKVDSKKLEKAEMKIQQKIEKREGVKPNAPTMPVLKTASASQVISKSVAKADAKGQSRSMDVRIENFDVSFGDRVLLTGADLLLAGGRRYGLVGRNGLGKTTLLRMISEKQLQIPSHISILHVEQEVVGDDTIALNSVLECDDKLNELWRLEKEYSKDPNKSAELSEVYAQLQLLEADRAPARAAIILNGLGFNKAMQAAATRTFSGGWRMRLALARALFSRPDLLLLDEPTNMLGMLLE
jgi:ATP-binding cassette, subfamily F, member 3